MIKVSLKNLNNIFDQLINDAISKEEASNWASERMFAHDDSLLEFEPIEYKPVIWDGIMYLVIVDTLNPEDGSYLYGKEDFIDYQKQLFNNQSFLVKGLFERDDKFRAAEKEVLALEEKYPNQSDKFYMEQTDKILEKKGLLKSL